MQCQWHFGCHCCLSNVLQDNENTFSLMKNCKVSSGKEMRALKLWCFFVTKPIVPGNVSIECSLTDCVMSDHSSKALEGMSNFEKQLRDLKTDDIGELMMMCVCTQRTV